MRNNNTIQINKISEEAKASLRTRVISSIVGICILIPALLLGDWVFLGFIVVALAISVIEIIRCAKKKYSRWCYLCMFLLCMCLTFWPMLRSLIDNLEIFNSGHVYFCFNSLYLSIIILALSIFALFYVIMWDENFTVRDACFLFTMGLIVSLGFQSLLYLRFIPLHNDVSKGFINVDNTVGSISLIIYLLIAVFGTDIGAYFTGMLFGKKKINERISPKKTWAGFWGGLAISTILSCTFGLVVAIYRPMLEIFDLNHWYNVVILSVIIPPFATLGDFVFSAIKRYYGIKDFGNLMPGHGGILDRCDSILFSSILAGAFVALVMSICQVSSVNPLL